MSVIGGIFLFAAGVAAGSGAVVFNRICVNRESEQLRRENEHLKTSAWYDRLEFEAYKAYGDGYYDGSRSPMSDVEKFADFLERRKIDYRFPKGDERHAQGYPRKARRG